MMTRRQAIKGTAVATAVYAMANSARTALAQPPPPPGEAPGRPGFRPREGRPPPPGSGLIVIEPLKLPPLPYPADALEPHIDARTMELHHDKHHAGYVTALTKALGDYPELSKKRMYELLWDLDKVPEKIRMQVRNFGGGHHNHSMFWLMMRKGGGGEPRGELRKAIERSFGSFDGFRGQLTETATKIFGSGWAWLVWDDKGLAVESTPNQDSPLSQGKLPLLGIDVWEHAYYLKHQNRRPDYVAAWFNVINWDYVAERYAERQGYSGR